MEVKIEHQFCFTFKKARRKNPKTTDLQITNVFPINDFINKFYISSKKKTYEKKITWLET